MLIAQISDSHFLVPPGRLAGRFETAAAFERLMGSLANLAVRPDLILFSGDLGELATREEYFAIGQGLRRLEVPVLAVPGNHDLREPMWSELGDMLGRTEDGFLCVSDDRFPMAVIGLDTLVEGEPHGELCRSRLAWLEAQLEKARGMPALLFMHHPPLQTGLEAMDRIGLRSGAAELERFIRAHGGVQAILCGHMHRAIQGQLGGVPVRVAPSVSHQIAFDIRDGEPYRFSDEPPQFMMHLWQPGSGFVSHVVPVNG
ncbi:3',5'-cyclic AMP phosphodiesterase CpdA [Breoghania corrubedonensis]|uniref:3',5'-cyclic AMP phosphodiesterase CpdA n=1 Tax=Breoghania corrubedonensis TaxID=665038 RepID=A0A2T5US61_9HYPH|nr:phosphodiesterase [Breoghania corrubedonensis]PTW54338.1 3',5'-cyclic AMP phosphodiesterase CpdA [Breoghania corrubedonensis]